MESLDFYEYHKKELFKKSAIKTFVLEMKEAKNDVLRLLIKSILFQLLWYLAL